MVKRYDIYIHSDDVQFLRESYDGDYVRYADYEAALARVEAAERACDAALAANGDLLDWYESASKDAKRYCVLKTSVLSAPMSAGMELLTTEADIDAQCDQIIAGQLDAKGG